MNTDNKVNICRLLKDSKTIAVVGISREKWKTSRKIASFLADHNYDVVGVNPSFGDGDADGIKVYKSISDIPHQVDIINVFRRSEDIPALIEEVLEKNPKALWLQQGIRNDNAVKPVIEKGIITIQDECIFVEYNNCKSFSSKS
ncbi:MAG TPA: CoA-binding protein [Melioribacteraceae bacterium]|nr:CoA-binding protein [Melioribacteraceae bacterium]